MYIDTSRIIRGGKTYTRHLLRESYRANGKVLHRTIVNVRGYPETFAHCYSEITQPPCGNETQGDRRDRACLA
jgi:hypothetical protein